MGELGIDLAALRRLPVAELEALYTSPRPVDVPRGRFRGVYLARIDNEGSRRPQNRFMVYAGFRLPPFGVDFTSRAWFFFAPRARVGRFAPRPGASRWRTCDVVALHYGPSRLPGFVRRLLYDEVKPLDPDLCLGIGGLDRGPGRGDLFFFALTRVAS